MMGVAVQAGMPTVHAQAAKHEWKDAVSAGYKYRYVTNDPTQARFYTLANGMTVILSVDKSQPRIQSFIAVKAGSKTDPSTHTGLAHYLEHMLFKGTDKFGTLDYSKEKPLLDEIARLYEVYNHTADEAQRKALYRQIDSVSGEASKYAIANEYDKMVANLGAQGSNAFTSFEQTVYMEDIPSNAIDKYLHLQAERFRNPVLRIFHTELEAVYEEKNISLDNDDNQAFEMLFAKLFPTHNYGLQTTIGTVEHLKNPSLVEIQKYFDNYYVPNNMGIIMSGDFDPDVLIKKIDAAFAYMKPKKIEPYLGKPLPALNKPSKGEVIGPKPESLMIGWRFPGASSEDAHLLNILGQILTNGSAGIFDLNLVQQQKLLGAYAFPYQLIDHSMLILSGQPSEGQSLEEVEKLMLAEIENLKNGNFSDDLIPSIVNNYRKQMTETYENYSQRAYALMDIYTTELDWKTQSALIEQMKNISKEDIMNYARKYLQNNYVAVYKRKGEKANNIKVEKPEITPISINEKDQSTFMRENIALKQTDIEPVWLDYDKDLKRNVLNGYDVWTIENKANDLFRLYYYLPVGKWDSRTLPIAADFINYVGTQSKSAEQISQEFYSLASGFRVMVQDENTIVELNGLNDNLEQTIAYFSELIETAKADPNVWKAYKQRLMQARTNAKEDKRQILSGLQNYARYGKENPFNNVLSDQELEELDPERLLQELKNLLQVQHRVMYYGPSNENQLAQHLTKYHFKQQNTGIKSSPKRSFRELPTQAPKVYFAHYEMVQADISWVRVGSEYSEDIVPINSLFNQYFGGGMGSIVFQTIRESKALAYSSFSRISTPNRPSRPLVTMAFVGTQADKFNDATGAMNELLSTLPRSEKNLESARSGLLKSLASERVNKDDIFFSYLAAERFGRKGDIRKTIYEGVSKLSMDEIAKYHQREMSGRPFVYCIVADRTRVKKEDLEKLGPVEELDLKTIFGY